MSFKLNIRDAGGWVNLLQDLYIEIDNSNWTSTSLSGFLTEVQTSLDGKMSRQLVRTATSLSVDAFDVVLVDTSTSAVTATLPVSATSGDEIYIADVSGDAVTNNITVTCATSGEFIGGADQDLILDVALASVKLIFDEDQGWHIDVGGSYLGADNSSINDPFLTLNADFTSGSPTENGGIIMSRGDSNDAIIRWNETTDKWEFSNDGSTFTPFVSDHGDLTGLTDSDDHTQYMHISTDRTVTATHTFNPDSAGPPFLVGANADGELVEGLNSELANGILFTTSENAPASGNVNTGDVWFEMDAPA